MKKMMMSVVALLVINAHGDDDLAWLEELPCIHSVKRTPTHLVFKFTSEGSLTVITPKEKPYRSTAEYAEKGEDLILDPVYQTYLSDMYHASISFTPVLFKNQMKGFRIVDEFEGRAFGMGVKTNHLVHIALGKKKVKVGEEDVQEEIKTPPPPPPPPPPAPWETDPAWADVKAMIEEDKRLREERLRKESLSNNVGSAAVATNETPAAVAEDEQSEEKRAPFSLWFYALIPPALLAAFYFLRRTSMKN